MGPEVIWTLCIIDITRRYFKHSLWRNAFDKDTLEAVTVSLLEFDILYLHFYKQKYYVKRIRNLCPVLFLRYEIYISIKLN